MVDKGTKTGLEKRPKRGQPAVVEPELVEPEKKPPPAKTKKPVVIDDAGDDGDADVPAAAKSVGSLERDDGDGEDGDEPDVGELSVLPPEDEADVDVDGDVVDV